MGLNKDKPKETTLEIYQQCFEDEFIAATELYFTAESSQFIESNSVADYMKKAQQRASLYAPLILGRSRRAWQKK